MLEAMRAVPRDLFVPSELAGEAWDNVPLPIGAGQTISQPLVVARMLEMLELRGGERILDIGTGSGYHAALLGRLGSHVWSVERHRTLSDQAKANLERGRDPQRHADRRRRHPRPAGDRPVRRDQRRRRRGQRHPAGADRPARTQRPPDRAGPDRRSAPLARAPHPGRALRAQGPRARALRAAGVVRASANWACTRGRTSITRPLRSPYLDGQSSTRHEVGRPASQDRRRRDRPEGGGGNRPLPQCSQFVPSGPVRGACSGETRGRPSRTACRR